MIDLHRWDGRPTVLDLLAVVGRATGLVRWSLLDAVREAKRRLA